MHETSPRSATTDGGKTETTAAPSQPQEQAPRRFPGPLGGALIAELVGTYFFTFFGTATIVLFGLNLKKAGIPGTIGLPIYGDVAIALAFGFGILIAVYAFLKVSGAHVNPAVTVALAIIRKFPWSAVLPYVIFQFAGGLLAALTVRGLFGPMAASHKLILGATHPGPTTTEPIAFVAEVVITFTLMIAIMGTALDARSEASGVGAGLAIGLTVAAGILAVFSVSGGSFNPARTLGPMIISGYFPAWWVYIAGPLAGATLGALVYEFAIRPGVKPEMSPQA